MPLRTSHWNSTLIATIAGLCLCSTSLATQTWCGKNYRKAEPIIPPKGTFPPYEELLVPHLAFQCIPRRQVYLESDGCDASSILVDTSATFTRLRYSAPLPDSHNRLAPTDLNLEVIVGEKLFSFSDIPFNARNLEFPISLCGLRSRIEPYMVTCVLELGPGKFYTSTASLSYLSQPDSGSVTTLDRKTGALMIKPTGETYMPVFPIGFYTNFGGYLASNLSILDEIKSQGFNTIHPVPPFREETNFKAMLDYMDDIGLHLIYDMRHTYQDLKALEREVTLIKDRKSLLLWYTGDEPDGPGDPLDATRKAYDLINHMDGYHPVSIALNCADYFFEEYVSGADIIMPDVYAIGSNVTFSSKYDTPCTADFGCCGCDNCEGRLEDISKRLDTAKARLTFLDWDKTKFIWAIPQAFGGEEFWKRPPTGREWLAQAILSMNHGARGIIPWIDPTPVDIKEYASRLATALPQIVPFLFDENGVFRQSKSGRVDISSWSRGPQTLVMAINMDDATSRELNAERQATIWILKEGVTISIYGSLAFEPLGSAIFIRTRADYSSPGASNEGNDWRVEHDEL